MSGLIVPPPPQLPPEWVDILNKPGFTWADIGGKPTVSGYSLKSSAGWWKCPFTGVIIQWVEKSLIVGQNLVYFPLAFPSACRGFSAGLTSTAVTLYSKNKSYCDVRSTYAGQSVSIVVVGY